MYIDATLIAGGLTQLQWSPDCTVLATAWEKGGFALWSVFGALIVCSLSWDFGLLDNIKSSPFVVTSMAWGKEGYHLWMATKSAEKNDAGDNNGHNQFDGVAKMGIAKSVIASNPSCACNGELVLLTSEDRLFVGMGAVNVGQQQYSPLIPGRYNYNNSGIEDEVMPSTNIPSGNK